MATAQKETEEERARIAAALGNDKKKLRELAGNSLGSVALKPGTTSAAEKSQQRAVVQVTDELAVLDQLREDTTACVKNHNVAGLEKVVEQLERVAGSQVSAGRITRPATNRARLALQHIGILADGRYAAMKGQAEVLKDLALDAGIKKLDQRVLVALDLLATKRKLTDTLSPEVYYSHQQPTGSARSRRQQDRQESGAGRCSSAEPHLSSTWRLRRTHMMPPLTEQDIDKVERIEQHAHQTFINWKQKHDAKVRRHAAEVLAEAARKQTMWDQREAESAIAQKQAFAAWLRKKSRQSKKAKQTFGGAEERKMRMRDDTDAMKRCHQNLGLDPMSEQCLLDAIMRGVVVGTHRVPLLQQLYRKHQLEWAWDSRPLGEADRKTFLFSDVEENCTGGLLEPFLQVTDPIMQRMKSRGLTVRRSVGFQLQ